MHQCCAVECTATVLPHRIRTRGCEDCSIVCFFVDCVYLCSITIRQLSCNSPISFNEAMVPLSWVTDGRISLVLFFLLFFVRVFCECKVTILRLRSVQDQQTLLHKKRHARTIVIHFIFLDFDGVPADPARAVVATYQENGCTVFFSVVESRLNNWTFTVPIVGYKMLYMYHRLLRDGHPRVRLSQLSCCKEGRTHGV